MKKNKFLYERAEKIMPGGVNSPVRAFKSVGGTPLFIEKGLGSKIWDCEGNRYIDYVLSWGPLILGHSESRIIKAVKDSLKKGMSFGAPNEYEIKLAELIIEALPSIEKIRMVNSGTEAAMSAIRLARAYTKKDKIIKFAGCYHGHSDSFLIKAGSGALTFGSPSSPGITSGSAKDTLNADFNDIDSVKKLIRKNKGKIAAVIIEPVAGNMGCVAGEENFLKDLKEITANEKILLIFDEVMTGFRVSWGGAQRIFNIKPDLTMLGKIIGGGFPVGAYGGGKDIMSLISPEGPVYQAGTLSGNPIAMRAGYETLNIIRKDKGFYRKLRAKSGILEEGIKKNIEKLNIPLNYAGFNSMSCLYFAKKKATDYKSALKSDTKKFAAYFKNMLKRKIYIAPSRFESVFLSSAHTEKDLELTIKANYESLKAAFLK